MKHTDVISDYAVDVIESHPPYQNNVLDLSEESVTQSNHCSQSESMKGGHSDTGSLSVPSPPFQTMKRAGSLPSTLLRYVSVPNFMLQVFSVIFLCLILSYMLRLQYSVCHSWLILNRVIIFLFVTFDES